MGWRSGSAGPVNGGVGFRSPPCAKWPLRLSGSWLSRTPPDASEKQWYPGLLQHPATGKWAGRSAGREGKCHAIFQCCRHLNRVIERQVKPRRSNDWFELIARNMPIARALKQDFLAPREAPLVADGVSTGRRQNPDFRFERQRPSRTAYCGARVDPVAARR